MDEPEVVIKVDKVYKNFRLPHENTSTIKGIFTTVLKSVTQHKTIETQHALKDISFEIKKGEFFGIVGRNGSGKSTLLKILAGIYQPTKGTISVKGKLVPFIELGVGFNPELSGRDNVFLNGALLGFSQQEVAEMYDEIVKFAELEQFMDQKLKNYSSGMQVRLAFSMAIRAKAEILLVDEVLAVGDADFQRKCFDYFQALKGTNTTVVFVSHNMNAVREYCDKALLIDKSHIVDIADPSNIAKLYSLMFIDEAQNDVTKKTLSGKRWGNKYITYDDVKLSKEVLSDEKTVSLKLQATANTNLTDLIFGFSVKNAAKQIILGTNSQFKEKKIKALQPNEHITLTWTIPNIFSDGQYTIDTTVVMANGQECDWWEDAASFTVTKPEEHAPYLTSPLIDLEVSD